MTNRFNRSTNSALPRNRIGAFATDFPNMLLTSRNVDTLTLFNYYSTSLDYRQHSAFKVRVKPRQAMANINTKLIEQRAYQQTNYELPSNTQQAQVSAAVHFIEDEKHVPQSQYVVSEDEKKLLMLNKDGFRPSTVKKFTKKPLETSPSPEKKELRNKRSKVRSCTQYASDDKNLRRTKTDLNDNSIKCLNKEMSSISLETIRNQIDDQQHHDNKEMNSPESIQNLLMKNLTDQEFINVLKEYRKTKRLNINTITQSIQNSNNIANVTETNDSSPPPLNSPKTATTATTSTINLESQFLDRNSSSPTRFNAPSNKAKINYPSYYVNYVNTKMIDHEKSMSQTQNSIEREKSTNQKTRPHTVKVLNIPMFAN